MTRLWFNKTFSLIHVAMKLVRMGDAGRRYTLIHSRSNSLAVGKLACDIWKAERTGKTGKESEIVNSAATRGGKVRLTNQLQTI